jgi:selenocysteine-specific elongation factor
MTRGKFLSIAVVGHTAHGKTTLVRRLSGIGVGEVDDPRRCGLPNEPLVTALRLPSGICADLVDIPGEGLETAIRILSGVDMVVTAVAANDGVMPGARRHLQLLDYLGIKAGVAALTKADAVDEETLELAEIEVREAFEGSVLEGKPVIPVSALDGGGLAELLRVLDREADMVVGKSAAGPFRLRIDQVTSRQGFGTMVSGVVASGILRKDDPLELFPAHRETKPRFIEVHQRRVDQASAGQRAVINLPNLSLGEVVAGDALGTPGSMITADSLNAEVTLEATLRRPWENGRRVKLGIGAFCADASVIIMERDRLDPGETALVQIALDVPAAVVPRDRFVVCDTDMRSVLGGGKILEVAQARFTEETSREITDRVRILQKEDVKGFLRVCFAEFPHRPVTSEEIARWTGFPVETIDRAFKSKLRSGGLMRTEGGGYYEKTRYESFKSQVVETTKRLFSKDPFKSAVTRDEIRFQLAPDLDETLFSHMLGELCAQRALISVAGGYRIPNFFVKQPAQQAKLLEKALEFAAEQGLATFSVGTFKQLHGGSFTYRDIEKALNHLHSLKKLVRLGDDRYVAAEAMDEIKRRVTEFLLRKGGLTIQDARDIFGFGRTRAVPILDYLDEIGVTRRVGDVRVPAARASVAETQRQV